VEETLLTLDVVVTIHAAGVAMWLSAYSVAESITTAISCRVTTHMVLDLDSPCLLAGPCFSAADSREFTPS